MSLPPYSLKPFLTSAQLNDRIKELATQIDAEFKGEEVTAVFLLNGAMFFGIDLIRQLDSPLIVDTLSASSYEGTVSTGVIKIHSDLKTVITGKNVLIIEDIIDTGQTLNSILHFIEQKQPKKVVTVCLLDKPSQRKVDVKVEYVGFTIENHFVVGYGLDYNQFFRNLKEISIYCPE